MSDYQPTATVHEDGVTLRSMQIEDGAPVWELVKDTGVLDLNSAYAYLMMGAFFPLTSIVAEEEGHLLGFTIAFFEPEKDDTVFLWQIGVSPKAHGKGIGSRILDELMDRTTKVGAKFLETTVTPSNEASEALFKSLARRNDTNCDISPFFRAEHFPKSGETAHEGERLFRIGPFS
ncbi:MAG: diaminobutyrate acetyltransferase [Alphaproteobacteria bacterium]|nr:diaminobutyrate acetyltransferase [Alphaproteobacteria bacterium]